MIAGVDADLLDLICRVEIHIEFMSSAVRKAIENGERPRTLCDYVSNAKRLRRVRGHMVSRCCYYYLCFAWPARVRVDVCDL